MNSDQEKVSSLSARLQDAAALLEAIAENRALLADMPEEERVRFLQAAGQVSRPDTVDRRRLRKAQIKKRNSEKLHRDQSVLNQTGIRKLRKETVFTTPNVYPPLGFEL